MTCVWDFDPACLGAEWEDLTDEVKERSLMWATSALQMLTLYRVGTCPITIRPCPKPPRCGCGWNPYIRSEGMGDNAFILAEYPSASAIGSFTPNDWNGTWYNSCGHGSCGAVSEIDIPGPVGYIESLRVDGVDLNLWNGDWRLDNGHLLVWQGEGPSPIPETQDLSKPDSEVGTWSLTYSRSYPVLEDGRIAVAYLAMEFARACKPKGKCDLPRGVVSVVRNGVSFTIAAGLFPNGLTNIEIVDAYILKWAPAGSPTRSATVFDPRAAPVRRTNGVPARGPVGSL